MELDHVEDDEVKGRKMMMLQMMMLRMMMLRRRRKMVMLRMMMLRTRTDPKTGNHLQVKCRQPRPGTTLSASLRSRNAHQIINMSQDPF